MPAVFTGRAFPGVWSIFCRLYSFAARHTLGRDESKAAYLHMAALLHLLQLPAEEGQLGYPRHTLEQYD